MQWQSWRVLAVQQDKGKHTQDYVAAEACAGSLHAQVGAVYPCFSMPGELGILKRQEGALLRLRQLLGV